jgi:hypothetical protein
MQTTIQLDDALLAEAAKLAHDKGCDLSHLIEETLREKIARAPHNPHIFPRPFVHLTTVGGQGLRPGVNIDDSAALFELMERQA